MSDGRRISTQYWGWASSGPLGIEVHFDKRFRNWEQIQSTEVGPERDALLNELRVYFFGDIEFSWNREYKYARHEVRSQLGFGSEARKYREYAKRMLQERDAFLAHHQDNAIFLIDYLKAHPDVEQDLPND